jgi:hypothetical protein
VCGAKFHKPIDAPSDLIGAAGRGPVSHHFRQRVELWSDVNIKTKFQRCLDLLDRSVNAKPVIDSEGDEFITFQNRLHV